MHRLLASDPDAQKQRLLGGQSKRLRRHTIKSEGPGGVDIQHGAYKAWCAAAFGTTKLSTPWPQDHPLSATMSPTMCQMVTKLLGRRRSMPLSKALRPLITSFTHDVGYMQPAKIDYTSLSEAVEKRAALTGVSFLPGDDDHSSKCLKTGLIITTVSQYFGSTCTFDESFQLTNTPECLRRAPNRSTSVHCDVHVACLCH